MAATAMSMSSMRAPRASSRAFCSPKMSLAASVHSSHSAKALHRRYWERKSCVRLDPGRSRAIPNWISAATGGATNKSPGRCSPAWPSATASARINREKALVSSTSTIEWIPAPASARAPDASLQGPSRRREIRAIPLREMCSFEESRRPGAAIGSDQTLAGLDNQPVPTGSRAGGQRVERAKELGRQVHGGRRHGEDTPFRIGYIHAEAGLSRSPDGGHRDVNVPFAAHFRTVGDAG
jgi:hypothetical protein